MDNFKKWLKAALVRAIKTKRQKHETNNKKIENLYKFDILVKIWYNISEEKNSVRRFC